MCPAGPCAHPPGNRTRADRGGRNLPGPDSGRWLGSAWGPDDREQRTVRIARGEGGEPAVTDLVLRNSRGTGASVRGS